MKNGAVEGWKTERKGYKKIGGGRKCAFKKGKILREDKSLQGKIISSKAIR